MEYKATTRYAIELTTLTDVREFCEIASSFPSDTIQLTDGNYTINAKSILGVMYALEWNELWLVSDRPVYNEFKNYIK